MAETIDIWSWNVNGIRSVAKKGFVDVLAASGAEIVALQEVRATVAQIPAELRALPGWRFDVVAAERAGYSGVGLLARRPWDAMATTLGVPEFDCEGRVQMASFGRLLIVNVYFPNGSGKDRSNDRVPFKLAFYRRLFDLLQPEVEAGRPILVMGDFNTAHRDIDLARPRQNDGTSGFLPEEREEFDRWLRAGWVDTFRHHHPDRADAYTWWSQRFGVRERNIGWRIDAILASPAAVAAVKDAWIAADVAGSDHCPIGVRIDRGLLTPLEPSLPRDQALRKSPK